VGLGWEIQEGFRECFVCGCPSVPCSPTVMLEGSHVC
jgi:hypothetical protein